MSNKATKELQPIFNALREAEEILGKEMLGEIIKRLIRGAMAEGERNFLQDQRRNAAARSIGKTRDEYEKSLESKHSPGDVKEYQPKKYFSKDRTLEWDKNLTPKQMKALRAGEVFTLLDVNGKRYKMILMDSFNTIREKAIK